MNSTADDLWEASWQDGHRIADSPAGTREDAIARARAMPAAKRMVFSSEVDDYVDLDGAGAQE